MQELRLNEHGVCKAWHHARWQRLMMVVSIAPSTPGPLQGRRGDSPGSQARASWRGVVMESYSCDSFSLRSPDLDSDRHLIRHVPPKSCRAQHDPRQLSPLLLSLAAATRSLAQGHAQQPLARATAI